MITFLTILALFGLAFYTPRIVGAMFKEGIAANELQIGIWAFFLTAFIAMKWMI